MNNGLKAWKLAADSLAAGIPVMLLYVLDSRGSSPGRQGFFMTVNAAGDMEGSIGGGIMEHKWVELAKEKLKGPEPEALPGALKKQVHDKSAGADQSGMICSGEQTILLYPFRKQDAVTVGNIIRSLEACKNGTLLLSPEGIFFSKMVPRQDYLFRLQSETDWEYREKTGYKQDLCIVGGGHCSLALSRLMRSLDFYIRVYEERRDLKTIRENEWAHEKHPVEDYSTLGQLIEPGENRYVIIMTFGYRTDDTALRALLGKEFAYLGVLGSAGKMKKLMAACREAGIPESQLQAVHSPAGLSIKSHSPGEIAVSIAAEIIREKNRHRG